MLVLGVLLAACTETADATALSAHTHNVAALCPCLPGVVRRSVLAWRPVVNRPYKVYNPEYINEAYAVNSWERIEAYGGLEGTVDTLVHDWHQLVHSCQLMPIYFIASSFDRAKVSARA
jgi:hypothetical protein